VIDAGDFTPAAERGAVNDDQGTLPARLTTTDEQKHEAKRYLEGVALRASADGARVLVHWSRYPATIVEVHGHLEHLTLPTGVEAVYATDRLVERTVDGAEVPRDEAVRLARLKSELAAMREHAAGPTE
jgi:hypothetical protein